jgi:hypothetical protein
MELAIDISWVLGLCLCTSAGAIGLFALVLVLFVAYRH